MKKITYIISFVLCMFLLSANVTATTTNVTKNSQSQKTTYTTKWTPYQKKNVKGYYIYNRATKLKTCKGKNCNNATLTNQNAKLTLKVKAYNKSNKIVKTVASRTSKKTVYYNNISWKKVTNAKKYEIYVKYSQKGSWCYKASTTKTSYKISSRKKVVSIKVGVVKTTSTTKSSTGNAKKHTCFFKIVKNESIVYKPAYDEPVKENFSWHLCWCDGGFTLGGVDPTIKTPDGKGVTEKGAIFENVTLVPGFSFPMELFLPKGGEWSDFLSKTPEQLANESQEMKQYRAIAVQKVNDYTKYYGKLYKENMPAAFSQYTIQGIRMQYVHDDVNLDKDVRKLKIQPDADKGITYYSMTTPWWQKQYEIGNEMLWNHFYPGVAHTYGAPLQKTTYVHHDAAMGHRITKRCEKCGKTVVVTVPY